MFLIFYEFCKLEFLDTAILLQLESFYFLNDMVVICTDYLTNF